MGGRGGSSGGKIPHLLASQLRLGSGQLQHENRVAELRDEGLKKGILLFYLSGRICKHVLLVLCEKGRQVDGRAGVEEGVLWLFLRF